MKVISVLRYKMPRFKLVRELKETYDMKGSSQGARFFRIVIDLSLSTLPQALKSIPCLTTE